MQKSNLLLEAHRHVIVSYEGDIFVSTASLEANNLL